MKALLLAAVAALSLSAACAAQAAVLDFEDVAVDGSTVGYGPLPSSYHGFHWTNFAVIDKQFYPDSGYNHGVVSGVQTACGCANDFAETIDTLTAGGAVFGLNSGWFTSAWYDGATLLVNGYAGGVLIHSLAALLDTTGPSLLNFGWSDVDKVEFSISGGVHNDALIGQGQYFGVDNLSLIGGAVPEPAAWVLMICGFGLAGAALRRRGLALA
jgi:hypothetical protein